MVAAAAPALCWDDNDPFVLQMRHLSPPQKKEAASIKSRDQTTLRSQRGLQISAGPCRKSLRLRPRSKTACSARLGAPVGWGLGQLPLPQSQTLTCLFKRKRAEAVAAMTTRGLQRRTSTQMTLMRLSALFALGWGGGG